MPVDLSPEREAWLESQVKAGKFSSIDQALAIAVDQLKADSEDDDSWLKPLIDEALAALDRGEGIPWKKGDMLKEIHAKHGR